jgi:hypothetical protein
VSRRPDWDTSVLDRPAVVYLPDTDTAVDDPLARLAVAALTATFDVRVDASDLVETLGHAGVVAIRAGGWTFEPRESLLGWLLVATRGTPDADDLAVAARLRAEQLAGARCRR